MAKVVSCKKLSEVLKDFGIEKTPEEIRSTCEAFGRKVYAFIRTDSPEHRVELEEFLESRGIGFEREYWPGGCVSEIRVSYFKAWHWDE